MLIASMTHVDPRTVRLPSAVDGVLRPAPTPTESHACLTPLCTGHFWPSGMAAALVLGHKPEGGWDRAQQHLCQLHPLLRVVRSQPRLQVVAALERRHTGGQALWGHRVLKETHRDVPVRRKGVGIVQTLWVKRFVVVLLEGLVQHCWRVWADKSGGGRGFGKPALLLETAEILIYWSSCEVIW